MPAEAFTARRPGERSSVVVGQEGEADDGGDGGLAAAEQHAATATMAKDQAVIRGFTQRGMPEEGVSVHGGLRYLGAVATCKSCGEETETLVVVKVGGKSKKLCEDCADRLREEGEVAEASEAVVQQMMGYKGRR
jgi:hypothetical protein